MCGSLRVIDTPGHIPGHMSFLDERDGTLYAGDALTAIHGLVEGEQRCSVVFSDARSWSPGMRAVAAVEAREKLLAYLDRAVCVLGMAVSRRVAEPRCRLQFP